MLPLKFSRQIHHHHHQQGLSLVEVMIVVFVMGIGLLGLGALQAVSLGYATGARQKTQAVNLTYDVIDIVRANMSNAGYFANEGSSWSSTCAMNSPGGYQCSSGEPALECDLERWSRKVCSLLPSGRGRFNISPDSTHPGSLVMVVDVCWQDQVGVDTTATSDCDGEHETLFTTETQL